MSDCRDEHGWSPECLGLLMKIAAGRSRSALMVWMNHHVKTAEDWLLYGCTLASLAAGTMLERIGSHNESGDIATPTDAMFAPLIPDGTAEPKRAAQVAVTCCMNGDRDTAQAVLIATGSELGTACAELMMILSALILATVEQEDLS